MIKLNSISLSNIRRFADNVEIKVEDGATIFLAPNGTGKTAIFEAIELVLTQKIRRFSNDDIFPVIRDGCENARIELAFEGSEAYSVSLEPHKEPIFSGDLSGFYKNTPKDDLPYLFHMTHLLNQSQQGWFVQIDEKNAGEQLDHLPIGKDAATANKLMARAKGASTKLLNYEKNKYQEAEEERSKWKGLINERDELLKNNGSQLLSLEEIFKKIKDTTASELTITEVFSPNIDFIKTVLARASSTLEQRSEETINKITKLAPMRSIPDRYNSERKKLIHKKELLAETQSKRRAAKEQLDSHNAKINIEENNKKSSLKGLSELENINKKIKSRDQLKIKIEQSNAELKKAFKRYDTNKPQLIELEKQFKQSEELQGKYNKIRLSENSLIQDRKILRNMHKALDDWEKYQLDIEKYEQIKSSLNAKISEAQRKLDTETVSKNAVEVAYKQAITNFKNLNKASNLIHDAVVSIAKNLPKEQDDCPVCGVLHGYSQLQEKIKTALDAMNPALMPAKRHMEETEKELIQLNSKISKIDLELSEKKIELERVLAQINDFHVNISDIKQSLFPTCNNHSEAKQILDAKNSSVKNKNDEIEKSKSLLLQKPSDLELDQLRLGIQSIQKMQNDEQIIIKEKETKLLSLDAELNFIKSDLKKHMELLQGENIALLINRKKEEIEKIRSRLLELSRTKETLEKDIAETDKIINLHENSVLTTTQTIDEIKQNWKIVASKGTPSTTELNNVISKSEDLLANFKEKKEILNDLSIELGQWTVMDTLNDHKKKIDDIRGDNSEEDYAELLQKRVESTKKRLDEIETKHEALVKFSSHLKHTLNDTQKHMQSFVPLRNKLLKKIVVEPRYSEVETNTKQFRGKQQANTTTNMHGKDVFVSKTASEAQLTDLQLTFLLSMAKTHNWSSWKALLLDDPTQHHDLVHAAGVYDVLRDYIVDDGFQILLSTHDSMQANFFKRKLENDGIPVKIWELAATKNGVVAELRS